MDAWEKQQTYDIITKEKGAMTARNGVGWGLRMEAFPEQATTGVGGWGGDGSAQVAAISTDGSVRQAACDEDIIQ